MKLRKRLPFNYYEPQEPSFDEYVYCDKCADFVYEYCSIHGPLLVIPDDKVPANSNFPPFVPHAALTIPKVFLHIASSIIPGAGLGVFSTLTLPRGVRFGPYGGVSTTDVDSLYCWQLHGEDRTRKGVVDASDANRSNWMRYVNCARHWCEQNLVAYQYQGQIYYRTIKTIPRFTELLVFYGGEYARLLDVNLKHYDREECYIKMQVQSINEVSLQKTYTEDVEEIPMYEDFTLDETASSSNTCNSIHGIDEVDPRNKTDTVDCTTVDEDDIFHNDLDSDLTDTPPTVQYDKRNNTFQIEFNSHHFINSIENNSDIYNNDYSYNDDVNSRMSNKLNRSTQNINDNDEQRVKCHLCSFTTKFIENMYSHLKRFHKVNPVVVQVNESTEINGTQEGYRECNFCSFKTIYSRSIKRHIRDVHKRGVKQISVSNKKQNANEYKYKCNLCTFTTNNYKNIRRHLNCMHKESVNQSKTEQDTDANCVKCPLCEFTTNFKDNLLRHIKSQHKETDRQISELIKTDANSVGLRRCQFCCFTCVFRDSLRRHITGVHTGDKKYKCTYCEYSTNYPSEFNRHRNRHINQITFICDVCGLITYNKADLAKHIQRYHY